MKNYEKHVHIEGYIIEKGEFIAICMDNDTHAIIPGDELESLFKDYSKNEEE